MTFPLPIGGGASGLNFDLIENSLILNDDDSPYLTRTQGTPTDQDVYTISIWFRCGVTPSANGATYILGGAGASEDFVGWNTSDALQIRFGGTTRVVTNQVFRDTTGWYHFVMACDYGAAGSDKVKLYLNGGEITSFTTDTRSSVSTSNQRWNVNGEDFLIGRGGATFNNDGFDGYVAETAFIDGQQLEPTSFGEFDSNGVWIPKAISGLTFGDNGFHLDFAVAPGTGNGAGTDVSGNGNHFTENNLSASDQATDTPTRQFCNLNAVHEDRAGTLSNGNLQIAGGSEHQVGTQAMLSGQWCWEITVGTTESQSYGVELAGGAQTESVYTASFTSGDVIEMRFDADAGTLDRNLNDGGWTSVATGLTDPPYVPLFKGDCTVDFGQKGYAGTSGYKLLNTANQPEAAIPKGAAHFDTLLYTGDGTAIGSGGQEVNGLEFQPDLVWIKNRDAADNHIASDTKWGAGTYVQPSSTAVPVVDAESIASFDADGFTVGDLVTVNTNTEDYVAWCWEENAAAGMDLVTYTGTGSAGLNVSHDLGAVPDLIIVKGDTAVTNWEVYQDGDLAVSDPETDYMIFNTNAALADSNVFWNDTAPTDSQFTLGSNAAVNSSGRKYVAWLFKSIPGYSKIGSYEGNGNADGPFVHTGFRPAFVICKGKDSTCSWYMYDGKRSPGNPADETVYTDSTAAEGSAYPIDLLSNGFKLRVSGDPNTSETCIYIAFAEHPAGGSNVYPARAR